MEHTGICLKHNYCVTTFSTTLNNVELAVSIDRQTTVLRGAKMSSQKHDQETTAVNGADTSATTAATIFSAAGVPDREPAAYRQVRRLDDDIVVGIPMASRATDTVGNGNDVEIPGVPDELAAKFSKRRRFIKVGASTVPVALTLTSQPVMAWHCRTGSAWGSVQGPKVAASVALRHQATVTNECWTLDDLLNNTSRVGGTTPWIWAGTGITKPTSKNSDWKEFHIGDPTKNFNAGKKAKCSMLPAVPAGISGDTTIYSVLTSKNDPYHFNKLIILAMVNAQRFQPVNKCVINSADQNSLLVMARQGFYYPADPVNQRSGPLWQKKEIVEYLQKNYIATFTG
jgi:hypothetical protein